MKIYTGTGDGGKTSLFSGEKVFKSDDRIEAYGDVDELNSWVGVLIAHMPSEIKELKKELQQIQFDLFNMGAWLATLPGSSQSERLPPLTQDTAVRIEKMIDGWNQKLPALTSFILPGGHPTAAFSHIARTVCRRTERNVIRLCKKMTDSTEKSHDLHPIIVYLNRLSDYFFVIARCINMLMNTNDVAWKI